MIETSFWKDRRVLITGHTGFKGSWLSLWLQSMGARLTGYALEPTTQPSLFKVASVAQSMTSVIADIRDDYSFRRVMKDADPEVIIHMAAQPLVRQSYIDPVETYSINVMGLVTVLDAARHHRGSLRSVVNVTTDKCYENREWVWGYRENEALGGYDPYSSSKACAELVTAAYRNSYMNPERYAEHGIGLASARAGNVIGGGDWASDRLIPDMMRAVEKGVPVKIRSPHAIRPWQHVLEPLSGYLILAQRLSEDGQRFAQAWNFGPVEADARPVQWIAERLSLLWGDGARWELDEGLHPHEAAYLKLDCSKAAAELNWRPKWTLETALQRIVSWHKAHEKGLDMRRATLEQIQEYHNQWMQR